MGLEAAVGFLVALALPVWLVVEQVLYWTWFPKQAEKQVESGRPAGAPVSGRAATARRAAAMRSAQPHKAA